jgi:TonB family protein
VDATRVYIEGEVDTKPRKLSGASYSPVLKPGEELFVTLSWVVNENGDVADVEVVESGGKALDEAVIQTLRKSKYAPGVKEGVKVKVRMAVKFRFRAG